MNLTKTEQPFSCFFFGFKRIRRNIMVFMPVHAPESPSILALIAMTKGYIENIVKIYKSTIVYLHKPHIKPPYKNENENKNKKKKKKRAIPAKLN